MSELEKCLQHIRSNGPNHEKLNMYLAAYNKMLGTPKALNSISRIFSYYRTQSLLAWFDNDDLLGLRFTSWQASIIKCTGLQNTGVGEGRHTVVDMLYALLSGESNIIHWTSQYLVSDFFMPWRKDVACHDPQSGFYHSLQVKLALQGDWKHLVARAQYWLDNPPKKYVLYKVDCKFYIALASGDINSMQEALEELVSGKVNRIRGYEDPFAYEQGIISAWGVILSKIAFLHGYNVDIKHPLIPSEWLPVTPLDSYDIELDAFKSIKVFDPLIGKGKWLIEELEPWSPRPLGESPLSYVEACDLVGVKPIGG